MVTALRPRTQTRTKTPTLERQRKQTRSRTRLRIRNRPRAWTRTRSRTQRDTDMAIRARTLTLTVSVVSAGICHRNKVNNSIARLYRKAQPKDSIIYITLHYITLLRTWARTHADMNTIADTSTVSDSDTDIDKTIKRKRSWTLDKWTMDMDTAMNSAKATDTDMETATEKGHCQCQYENHVDLSGYSLHLSDCLSVCLSE